MVDKKIIIPEEGTTTPRCQEARGGLSYDVILATPSRNVVVPKLSVSPSKIMSAKEIEEKLNAAEIRRNSLEQRKLADISKLSKAGEARRKKDETGKKCNSDQETTRNKDGSYC